MAERGGKLPVPASSVLGNGIGGWFGGQTVPVPPREPVEEEEGVEEEEEEELGEAKFGGVRMEESRWKKNKCSRKRRENGKR